MELNVSQIEEGRAAALQNAQELFEDASLLLREGRWARSYALAHFAMEEMAKIPMLVRVGQDMLTGRDVDWSNFWRRFRVHQEKINNIHTLDYFQSDYELDGKDYEEYRKALGSTPDILVRKNTALYSEFDGGSFSSPSDRVTEQQARSRCESAWRYLEFFASVEGKTRGRLAERCSDPKFRAFWDAVHSTKKGVADSEGRSMVTLEFRTDETIEMRATRAQFRLMLGWRWVGIVGMLAVGVILLLATGDQWLRGAGIFILAGGLAMTILWAKTYWSLRSITKRHCRQLEDPTIRIELNDDAVEVSSSTGSRKTRWAHVSRKVVTADFLVMYSGKMAIAAIPRSALTSEAEAFVACHGARSQKP